MRITEKQLRQIIKEEKSKVLNEMWGGGIEILNPVVNFAQQWAGLGDTVQRQAIIAVNAYIENNESVVYNRVYRDAINMALELLTPSLDKMIKMDIQDADEIKAALEWAQDNVNPAS